MTYKSDWYRKTLQYAHKDPLYMMVRVHLKGKEKEHLEFIRTLEPRMVGMAMALVQK